MNYLCSTGVIMIKIATTEGPVLDLIRKRWSARSFADRAIKQEDLTTIIEAATWAASANNEQPWVYYYAVKGTPAHDTLVAALMPGNQPWAKNAAALLVSVARKTFAANGNTNAYAHHDTGMANATLLLQARSMDIYSHVMGGFNKQAVTEAVGIDDTREVVCVIALGYLDSADQLEEPFKTRELTPRSRKPLQEIAVAL